VTKIKVAQRSQSQIIFIDERLATQSLHPFAVVTVRNKENQTIK
jgi:hypothetical protein